MSIHSSLSAYIKANRQLKGDPLAEAALALAKDLDKEVNAVNATAFMKLMGELRRLAPSEEASDLVDELSMARERKLGGAKT